MTFYNLLREIEMQNIRMALDEKAYRDRSYYRVDRKEKDSFSAIERNASQGCNGSVMTSHSYLKDFELMWPE